MRKILFALIGCFAVFCAHAAQVVNVDYVHKLIAQKWDISVPIKTNNIMAVANMKYLLTAVDVANEILNGEKTTDYGNGEFATLQVADTVATIQAVDTLIQKPIEYKFFLTTTSTNSFSFSISAAGEFYIDWGDGKTQLITKNDVEYTDYSYKYKKTGTYTIKLGGIATGYTMEGDSYVEPAISFSSSASKIASIDGSLGAIFGTLADGTVPNFSSMFSGAGNLSSIPANLFSGVNGTQEEMFSSTFDGCSGLTSIPDGLFAGISGEPKLGMFAYTFYGCESLTYIPANLFAGVSGIISEGMFNGTFAGCTSLRTIPEELFASLDGGEYISGYAFMETFAGSGIESIPENLFGNITSSLSWGNFMQTFAYCPNLTGPSARINGVYLYNIWPDATEEQVYGMYEGSTGLDDYACIPYAWGGGGEECDSSSSTPSVPEDAVYDFYLTTTSDTDVFAMQISAAGEFYIDWGDGTVETITKPDTTDTTYSHNYDTAGAYTIGIGGQATAYNTNDTAAISFYVNSLQPKIASIDGSLGAIFGTLANGGQPQFNLTFYGASNMTGSIPSDLFAGISGAPARYMFSGTFGGCSGLTGAIPDGLFGNLTGKPAKSMFTGTFEGCRGLTSIPSDLFAGISGAPAMSMFQNTFTGCRGLTSIPSDLFAGISGAPAMSMFQSTFYGCSGLTSIPENLFGNISGTAQSNMFHRTFHGCTSLTGPSARINGQYLYEIWPSASWDEVGDMYYNATKLSDYSNIPTVWK